MPGQKNKLYYGDNLDVLRDYIADKSVDLIYLDPPFNSRQDYNVLFAEKDGSRSASQITAFKDTWEWNLEAERAYEIVERGGRVADAMLAFRTLLGGTDMLAYLAMMAPRLLELRRVLKATGSIYLHCDPTASHYLKLLMDGVFGPDCFNNEIIWKRTTAHNDSARYGRVHDRLLFYRQRRQDNMECTRSVPIDELFRERTIRIRDEGGQLYETTTLHGPGRAKGQLRTYNGEAKCRPAEGSGA